MSVVIWPQYNDVVAMGRVAYPFPVAIVPSDLQGAIIILVSGITSFPQHFSMELLLFFSSCVILVVSSLYLLRLISGDRRRNLPPGPRALPLLGNLLDLGANPHRSLARLADRHGPVMTLRLGTVTTVVASSASAARDVLQRHDAVFSARSVPDATRARDHDGHSMGWLPPGSPRWRALRKVCSVELFAPRCLNAHQALRRQKVERLVSHVARLAREGSAVDVGRVAFLTALNLVSCTIFSVDLACLDDERAPRWGFKDMITEYAVTVAVPNVSDFFPVLAPLDLQRLRRRLGRVFDRLHAIFEEQIERRLREPPKNDFLDALLDYRGAEDGRPFDRKTLLSLITVCITLLPLGNFVRPVKNSCCFIKPYQDISHPLDLFGYFSQDLFSAGSDTSATTVEWAMAELLRNPSTMAKARDELAQVMGSKTEIEESDIGKLNYLQAIVKETFRLHPPAPLLLPHKAETASEIGGYEVPKGAHVLVNVWAIGRSSEVWPEPEKFIPERFLEQEVDFRGRYFELLPFGSGRRMCPGMLLADRMVHLMLACLLHRFEWRMPADVEKNGVDMTEKFGAILSLATPLHAIANPAVNM
jgi:cytochrome P450